MSYTTNYIKFEKYWIKFYKKILYENRKQYIET